jgi:WD40 repeat protein
MGLYDAFVSYSHAKDKPIAAALQSVVQKLGKPWYRRRALRVFRDDTSLSATPHLWPSIQTALSESRFLILLASPEAAASPWVDKELAYWLEHKSIDTLLIASTDGELAWDDAAGDFGRGDHMPLPPALKGHFPTEPKWVDLRPYREGADPRDAKFTELAADFAAAIRGMPKEDLLSQEVRQQRRALSLAWSAAATLTVLIALAGWQWWEADRAKRAALAAEQVATEQKGIAETQRDRAVEAERSATEQKNEAQAQRDRALLTQSQFLADAADQRLQRGEASAAMLLALEALPDAKAGIERPYAPSAEEALFAARRSPHEIVVLAGHVNDVANAAFSPDGRLVVTASDDNTARVWARDTGATIHILADHSDRVSDAEFSPDGRRIVTSSSDKTARIWDVETGEVVAVLKGHQNLVWRARFSPDGRRIVTASTDWTARIWDAVTGAQITVLTIPRAPGLEDSILHVVDAVFSPDGETLMTRADIGISEERWPTWRTWNLATGKMGAVPAYLKGRSFVLSPDGRRVLVSEADKTSRILDFKTGSLIRSLNTPGGEFSPDGRFVVSKVDRTVQIWNAETGQMRIMMSEYTGQINNVRLSADGQYLVTASKDRTARIWSDEAAEEVRFLDVAGRSVAFSPDGLRFATATDKSAQIWDVETRQQLMEFVGHTDQIWRVKFSFDNRRLLTSSADHTARIWDIASGKAINVLSGHTDVVRDASFSPDGTRVVTASRDATARIWDAATGSTILVLAAYPNAGPAASYKYAVNSAVFSPDGTRVLTGAEDGSARIWDVETGKLFTVLAGHTGAVTSAVFSPDGQRIVTTSETAFFNQIMGRNPDNRARVWDAETGKMLFLLRGHADSIDGVGFRADGRRLLTASADTTARIWDTGTWQTIAVLKGGYRQAISPDGRLVATTLGDKVGLWTVFPTTQELIDAAKKGVGRCLTRAERDAAFLPPEPPVWCIEMGKWPYQSRPWKEWLNAKWEKGSAPLPDVVE